MYALPIELRPNPDYLVNDEETIDAAFRKAGYNNPYGLSNSKLKTTYDRMLGSVNLPFRDDSLGVKVWKYLLYGFDGFKATLTFKMISLLADYIVLNNPKILKALQLTYNFVFLDEFQDTTSFQYIVERRLGSSRPALCYMIVQLQKKFNRLANQLLISTLIV